eukprot:TRINITY_DN21897_c0_g1_i1.p1 TRINITY_DN21897_c0_g1~~TRINITY_DN21897_c0_g1_i1.p1  ORF type:complete len:371 (+),score=105.83 TRINITY_DN21897_c0_g1_i1:54-1166(+)
MTEFKKLTAEVDVIEECLKAMLGEDVGPEGKMEALEKAMETIGSAGERIEKVRKKAEEKDPEKQVYGEGMAKKVLGLCERYDHVSVMVEEAEATVRSGYQHVAERKKKEKEEEEAEEVRKKAREEQVRREIEEQNKLRLEQEREAMVRAEQERAERYKAACEAAEQKRIEDLIKIEREKQQRSELEAYLNRTPTRVLLHKGIKMLFSDCQNERIDLRGIQWLRAFDDCIRSLQQFCKNLSGHPDSLPLKNLRYSNENFYKDILSRGDGSLHILYSLGYRPAGFGENQFLVLEEIDPITRYPEWESWWEEVKWTRDYLQDLIESLRDHRRGVAKAAYNLTPHLPEISELELVMAQPEVPLVQQSNESALYS